ncbi:uncharacterized protein F4822DRAFT_417078 [Hypoxylon trugodes]|uniref:uncharacterized protein n=1 Tax=Hypoxylon trugodes TaxID=326681 RepID=UPI0021952C91|nr:uncharacterized protein F4822DRAFT_417078 [Hypoxylon trugodes]KAI1385030.1 hypothetical protein F4822DRAFT_417078 [Hypoxylon trugodes]
MSPVLTSQCRRAAHRHLNAQHDSIWLPEALLAIPFERFCVTSRTVARYGSSVPGPMESRRRMGKRRMGELSFEQSHSASPLWGLDNLPDLSQWQWKPPSSPNERLRHQQNKSSQERNLIQHITDWLAGTTLKSSNAAVTSLNTGESIQSLGEGNTTYIPEVAEHSLPKILWDAQSTHVEVIEVGLIRISRDLLSSPSTRSNFTHFCDAWEIHLADGFFSGETICAVLEGIRNGLDTQHTNDGIPLNRVAADNFMLCLLEATIAGLSGRSTHGLHDRDSSDCLAWGHILQKISELQINSMRIFTEAMARIPGSYFDDTSTSVLANLYAFMASGAKCKRSSTLIRQVNKMARPLARLNVANHSHIFEKCTQHILAHRRSKELNYPQMRSSWLQLLARLPIIDENYLASVCSQLEAGRETEPISNHEICEIFLVKHRLSFEEKTILRQAIQNEDDRDCYKCLSITLWQMGHFDYVKGLCEFLKRLGREQDVMLLVKGFRNLARTPATPLVNLAVGAGDPALAIEIFGFYEKAKGNSWEFWNTKFSTEILRTLTRSRSINPIKILDALALGHSPRRGGRNHRKLEITKATKAAMAFAVSPSVSPRISFRLISQCIKHLQRNHDGMVPRAALKALFHNITRDLPEGRPGRTLRLRWFLSLLQRRMGREKMVRVAISLRRWRKLSGRTKLE